MRKQIKCNRILGWISTDNKDRSYLSSKELQDNMKEILIRRKSRKSRVLQLLIMNKFPIWWIFLNLILPLQTLGPLLRLRRELKMNLQTTHTRICHLLLRRKLKWFRFQWGKFTTLERNQRICKFWSKGMRIKMLVVQASQI